MYYNPLSLINSHIGGIYTFINIKKLSNIQSTLNTTNQAKNYHFNLKISSNSLKIS